MESPRVLRLVEKTVEVLNLLADFDELTIAQLADRLGEPRSSLYRLLHRLEQLELVEQSSSRGYFRLGTHVLRWGAAAQSGMNVRKRSLSTMEELRAQTGLTVFLVIRRSWHAVCLERLEGARVSSLILQVGGWLPLHCGAAPRALLAFEPEALWHSYVDHNELNRMTPSTPDTAKRLFEVLAKEQDQGFCISDGNVTDGIASVGAPIRDHHNNVLAAISVSGLRDEVVGPKVVDRISGLILDGSASISRAMGNFTNPHNAVGL